MIVRRILASLALALPALSTGAVAARADDGVHYSPSPSYAGAFEQFSACGFQDGETVDVILDGNPIANAPAAGSCADVPFLQMALDLEAKPHDVSMKGRQSGAEQATVFVVVPPAIVSTPATIPGGTTTVIGAFFAPGRSPMLIPAAGGFLAGPSAVDGSGNLVANVIVPSDTPPGAYPAIISDPPYLLNPPPLVIFVNPKPSASPQTNAGWTLIVTSTLARDDGKVSVKGNSTFTAPFGVSSGQLNGQGQLTIGVDITVTDVSCHGDSQVPFGIGGTQSAGMFQLTFTGLNASAPINVTCTNGMNMPPFALPNDGSSAPFDVPAQDGQTMDFDGGSIFTMVPAGMTGHSHLVLTKNP